MIPRANITEWRSAAPWPNDIFVEQDLILSRALIEIFSEPLLSKELAFRGGTAIHKLFIQPPARYSEDIDLVQVSAGPIGNVINTLRATLDPWLGKPNYKQKQGRFTLYYRFTSETDSTASMRLKVEINTREHFSIYDMDKRTYSVDNPWFSGQAQINCYSIEELIGTKLRALYQRKKGRDLFDLAVVLEEFPSISTEKIVAVFNEYVGYIGKKVSRAEFESNLDEKMNDQFFRDDIGPLMPTGTDFDIDKAAETVQKDLLTKLSGEPWKGKAS